MRPEHHDEAWGPALGLLELASVAVGIRVGDAMVKRAPVRAVFAGTVHPGKYLVLVDGDVASVEEAMWAGREASTVATRVDELFLPDVEPRVLAALRGARERAHGEALGVVETHTAAALVGAADRGLKGAVVALREARLADDLGGKAYCLFAGDVAEVEAAVELAVAGLGSPELLVASEVIASLHPEIDANLAAAAGFAARLPEPS